MRLAPSLTLGFLATVFLGNSSLAVPAKISKPASQLIEKQAPPRIASEVLSLVNPGNARVRICISKQRAYLLLDEQVAIDSPISSGKRTGTTPVGSYTILQKNADHRSNLYGDFVDSRGRVVRSGVSLKIDSAPSGTRFAGAPMRHFMRLTQDGVGMHVGHLPGYPASHGCVRLPAEIAPLIFEKVKLGTPVEIVP